MRHNGLLTRWREPGHQKVVLPHLCYHRLTQRTQQTEREGQDKDTGTASLARLCTWAFLGTEETAGKIIPLPSPVLHWAARQPTGRTPSVTQSGPDPFLSVEMHQQIPVRSPTSRCYLVEQMPQWHPGGAQHWRTWVQEGAVTAGSLQPWEGKGKGKPYCCLGLPDQRIKGRWNQSLHRGE